MHGTLAFSIARTGDEFHEPFIGAIASGFRYHRQPKPFGIAKAAADGAAPLFGVAVWVPGRN